MANAIVEKAKERMSHSHQSLAREFGAVRAGRANASLLDRISVEYYGVETPLNQIASITIPEGENAKIAIRNIRRDAMDEAKKQEKAKEITEDELKTLEKDIQKVTDDAVKHIDEMTAHKEKELLEV